MKTLIIASLLFFIGCTPKEQKLSKIEAHFVQQEIDQAKGLSIIDEVHVGNCWSQKIKVTDYIQASFIKDQSYNSAAYLLMAYDPKTEVVLFAQPESDRCNEKLENSAKCNYWIRAETLSAMHIFFKDQSEIVPCPKGLSVKEIVKRASPKDHERFDFSKI